jgi:hypothetical protein
MFLCKLSCIAGAITLAITSAQGQSYNEAVLHHFDGYPFGQYPSRVISDAAGNFYGTAYAGGLWLQPKRPLIADCRRTADHILRARQLQERGAARATG